MLQHISIEIEEYTLKYVWLRIYKLTTNFKTNIHMSINYVGHCVYVLVHVFV